MDIPKSVMHKHKHSSRASTVSSPIPLTAGVWVGLIGWLYTKTAYWYPQMVTNLSSNWTRCTITLFMWPMLMRISQATTWTNLHTSCVATKKYTNLHQSSGCHERSPADLLPQEPSQTYLHGEPKWSTTHHTVRTPPLGLIGFHMLAHLHHKICQQQPSSFAF